MNLFRKHTRIITIAFILLGTVFAFYPNTVLAAGWIGTLADTAVGGLFDTISELLRTVGAWILAVVALFFEWVLKTTIAEINVGKLGLGAEGLGPAISEVWGTIRDIANLAFIFVLLYAAIKVILDLNTASIGSTIKNIIIIGLLINFSLFFSKVLIDVGNIPTIGFYNAIQAGAPTKPVEVAFGYGSINPGITSVIINATGAQSFWGDSALEYYKGGKNPYILRFINAALTLIVCLVLSVVLLVASVMFITRYILIILLLVLSPLAFIAYILPGLQGRFWEWFNNLKNQVFFPLLFMMMLWISIKMMATLGPNGIQWAVASGEPKAIIQLLLNYFLVVGFMVAALIFAKQMASKSMGFNMVSGGVMTGAAFAGRQTLGRGSNMILQSSALRDASKEGGIKGMAAKSLLWTSKKGASASYDVRGIQNTGVGKALGAKTAFDKMGKPTGEGGMLKARGKYLEAKAKEKAEYAKAVYGQTEKEKYKIQEIDVNKDKANESFNAAVKKETSEAEDEVRKAKEALDKLKNSPITYRGKDEDINRATEAHSKAEARLNEIKKDKKYSPETAKLGAAVKSLEKESGAIKDQSKQRQYAFAGRLSNSMLARLRGNKEAAQKVREQAKGKTNKDKAADLLKDMDKEAKEAEGKTEEVTPEEKEGGEEKKGTETT